MYYYVKHENGIIFTSESYNEALDVLKQYPNAELEYLKPVLKARTRVKTVSFNYFRFASANEARLIEELIPDYADLSTAERPTTATILVLDEVGGHDEELLKILSVAWDR